MARICEVVDCRSKAHRRGLCTKHYRRYLDERPPQPLPRCGVDGCDERHYGNGWCRVHWYRWKRHGDPLYMPRAETPWNPWAYRVACPQCGSDVMTMPIAPGELAEWRCVWPCHISFVPEVVA